jgi:hypothetical protein
MPNGLVRVSWAPASNAACRSGSVGQVSSRMEVSACGCRKPVHSCDLGIFVDQPADAIQPHDRYVGR